MTKWQEFPLRPQGRPWVGINTRGGRLDDGSGQLTDASTNVMINRADTLAKRKGLIRGLDERFDGTVCGLHRFTDECGREWLLVADEDSIKIRQPFAVPVFENSDAYPFDSFQDDGIPDPTRWRNTLGYRQLAGELRTVVGASPNPMTWFKEASSSSYQLRIQYRFDSTISSPAQVIVLIMKASTLEALTARLQLTLTFDGNTSAEMFFTDANGVLTSLGLFGLAATTTGFATIKYRKDTRIFSIELFPTLESQVLQDADPLTAVQDADLGQFSAIQLASDPQGVLFIDGGPI